MHVKQPDRKKPHIIDSDKRFQLQLIDVSLVRDRATVKNDDRNRLNCTLNKLHFAGKFQSKLRAMNCIRT